MARPRRQPDAREVDRFSGLMSPGDDEAQADAFLARCVVGSSWTARIRTAEVAATVAVRGPLGTLDERTCTCLEFVLARPVPVEPGLRFQIVADDDSGLSARGVVRPWKG